MKAYGAYGKKVLYGKETLGIIRSTFVIDPKVDGHTEQVLASF